MPSILVSGPVRGNFAGLFKAVAKAQKKGEFAAALCVGNFLGETREAPADARAAAGLRRDGRGRHRRGPRVAIGGEERPMVG